MVRGRRPKEQGEKDVSSPAKYKIKREVSEDEKMEEDMGNALLLLLLV